MDIYYNTASQTLDSGLTDFEIVAGMDYFIILSAPTNANARIKLNSNTNAEIPLKDGWQIKTQGVTRIYLSCDAVAGGVITYGQADGGLQIQPNPTINAIDTVTEISSFNSLLLAELNKISNPYDAPTYIQGSINNVSLTTGLNITLDCDKITIFLDFLTTGYNSYQENFLIVLLDGYPIMTKQRNNGTYTTPKDNNITLENVRGKSLEIKGSNYSGSYPSYYTVSKYNLKV